MAIEGTEDRDISELSDEELDARQRAEDGEEPGTDPIVGDTPTPTPEPTPEPTPAPTSAPAAENAGGAKVEGVLSKDGSRVLPYAALQAERRSARAASSKAERLERDLAAAQQQIADLKAGKPLESPITEADVAQMEADFPEEGKKMRALFDRTQDLESRIPKNPPPQPEADDPAQVAQDAIDQVPLLLEWQTSDWQKFERAQEIDAVLLRSPKWVGKPEVERFEHVARMVADEFDIPFPETKPKPSASPPAAPAAPAVPEPQRKPPETLSDFKGGSVADHGSIDPSRTSPRGLLARFNDMTDEEIDAHLAKYG